MRKILGKLVKITLKKHSPIVIVITGDNMPSLVREIIYNVLKQKFNTRRNLERTESEFSIPLTIFGTLIYPKSYLKWGFLIFKTSMQTLYMHPYSHALVLQLPFINKEIFGYWLKILSPNLILNTGTGVNYHTAPFLSTHLQRDRSTCSEVISINQNEVGRMRSGIVTKTIKLIGTKFGIDKRDLTNALRNFPVPSPRINIIPAKNNSIIIDARHYYYPPNIQSVIETTESMHGDKYIFSTIKADKNQLPSNYRICDQLDKRDFPHKSIIIFRGTKDEFVGLIKSLSLNELEV